jgi:hypothetical protein
MGRQYYQDVIAEPPLADLAAITATTETQLWAPAQFTPIYANDMKPGKIYRCTAGGIMSFAATGALTITPRFGTSIAGTTLGASIAKTTPGATTALAWFLQFDLICRSLGAAGANSTVIGHGFIGINALTTAGSEFFQTFGGTQASVDATVASALCIGWTLSVAGTVTPKYVSWVSLN